MNENAIDLIKETLKFESVDEFESRYTNPVHKYVEEDGKAIAHLGCDKRCLVSPEGEIEGGFMLDNAVVEEKRKQGIFTALYKEFEKENEDIDLFYGFPLQYELLNLVDKQDYSIVGEVQVFAKILNSSDIMQGHSILGSVVSFINKIRDKRSKTLDISGVEVSETKNLGDIENLGDKTISSGKIYTKRTTDFLSKRLKHWGDCEILVAKTSGEFSGYLIYRFIERNDIKYYMTMDILAKDEVSFEALISKLVEIGREREVSLVGIWQNSVYSTSLKRLGFSFARSSIPFVAKKRNVDFDIKNINNWYLQPIEGEIY